MLRRVDPACLSSRHMWTPDPRYMAPELRRGACGTCGDPVTYCHLRFRDEKGGAYYHCDAECVPAAHLVALGACGFCGAPVHFPLLHAKVGGVWYHGDVGHPRSCWRRMDRLKNGGSDDDKENDDKENDDKENDDKENDDGNTKENDKKENDGDNDGHARKRQRV